MNKGATLTFVELVEKVDFIQVPIIQRDYAQGRIGAGEVRRNFLDSIKSVLLDGDNNQLDLDFVYGSFDEAGHSLFSVLDGQQRLTTLFLLHWYLAMRDGCLELFRQTFVSNSHSRFSYKTRVSASEFFDALALSDDVYLGGSCKRISEIIINRQWFFISWKSDPTVNGCLMMLDEMHNYFGSCNENLYVKLVDKDRSKIVFQYLNLESFGLSEELYIKMNARGKPLSDFENFKAWLCRKLEVKSGGADIERKMDQGWADVFWRLCQKSNDDFDGLYLRFFNLIAFYRACERVNGSFEYLDDDKKSWIRVLRTSSSHNPTSKHEKYQSFDDLSIDRFELLLDYFFKNIDDEESVQLLRDAVTSNDYLTQIRFYSFVLYLESANSAGIKYLRSDEGYMRWRRVSDNLINNQRIDELATFIPSVRNISELSDSCLNIYEYLSDYGIKIGFTKEQREEECLKAKLILMDKKWESLLVRFEQHPYLKGKVGFLLEMAKDDDLIDRDKFEEAAIKAAILLSDDILRSKHFILERALLAIDDYLVHDVGSRYSFCRPNRSTYRERSENWFKVVGKPVFKSLIDKLDCDVEKGLEKIISTAQCGGWRKLIIDCPDTISYCLRRLVHKDRNNLFLLSKSTFRGYHAELRTFVFEKYLNKIQKDGELPSELTSYEYVYVYGDNSPYIEVVIDGETYDLEYDAGSFFIWSEKGTDKKMPPILKGLLKKMFPGENVDDYGRAE